MLIPDARRAVARFLREHVDLQALIGERVRVQTPSDTSEPWVRYAQLDARRQYPQRTEHLIAFLLQFDCYAGQDGGWPEASLIGRTVRALLFEELPEATDLLDGIVVTSVDILSDADLPDVDFKPSRERRSLTVQVHAHA